MVKCLDFSKTFKSKHWQFCAMATTKERCR